MGPRGLANDTCGTSQYNACTSLLDAINKANDGDIIMVDGEGTQEQPLIVCSEHYVSKSISIIGYNGTPTLTCNKTRDHATSLMFVTIMYKYYAELRINQSESYVNNTQDDIIVDEFRKNNLNYYLTVRYVHYCINNGISFSKCYRLSNNYQNIHVYLKNLYFVQIAILASDITLSLHDVTFIDASVYGSVLEDLDVEFKGSSAKTDIVNCKTININMTNVYFFSESSTGNSLMAYIILKCNYLNLYLSDSIINGKTIVIVPGVNGGQANFNNVLFNGSSTSNRYGGLDIDKNDLGELFDFRVDILNSTFENIYPPDIMLPMLYEYLGISYGAVYIKLDTVGIHLNIQNTMFVGNERAISIGAARSDIIIVDCKFINNTSMFSGGAVHIKAHHDGIEITLNNNVFEDNQAGHDKSGVFDGCLYYTEQMTQVGKQYVRNCSVIQGVIYYKFQHELGHTYRVIKGDAVEAVANKAKLGGSGGAIHLIQEHSTSTDTVLLLHDCLFQNNQVTRGDGGALYVMHYQCEILQCNFTHNEADQTGGALYSYESFLEIKSCHINNNTANSGSGIYSVGSVQIIQISESVIKWNYARQSGGGVWIHGGMLQMEWCNVKSNAASFYGGGIYLFDVNAHISYSIVEYNEIHHLQISLEILGFGGGMSVLRGTLIMEYSNVSYNEALYGGGIFILMLASTNEDYVNRKALVNIVSCNIRNNSAVADGGGVYLDITTELAFFKYNNHMITGTGDLGGMQAHLNISNSNFTFNLASYSGGGLRLRHSVIYISETMISNNTAYVKGGGISIDSCMNEVKWCNITGNIVVHKGSGIQAIMSNTSISNSMIMYNKAVYEGGGIYIEQGHLNMTWSLVTANQANHNGGGMILKSATTKLTHVVIENNLAKFLGGGIHITYKWMHPVKSVFEMELSDVKSNIAKIKGGGLYASFANINMSNTLIENNEAGTQGGGAYIMQGQVEITDCQVQENQAGQSAGGLYIGFAGIDMLNNTIKANKAHYGGGVVIFGGEVVALISCHFYQNEVDDNSQSLFVHNSFVHIQHSTFNISVGAHIYMTQFSNITAENCYFSNGMFEIEAGCLIVFENVTYVNNHLDYNWNGVFISNGTTMYNNVNIILNDSSLSEDTIAVLSGKSVIEDLYISCPNRYDAQIGNTLLHNATVLLNMVCSKTCNRGYNMFSNGYTHLKRDISGYVVQESHSDLCKICPYGGSCSEYRLSAKPGFWGGVNNNELFFFPCKSSHCDVCNTDCSEGSFDMCAPHREGPICTACRENYTEALFSSTCISDDHCTDSWFWSVCLILAVVYSMFLLFQGDLGDFIFNIPVRFSMKLPTNTNIERVGNQDTDNKGKSSRGRNGGCGHNELGHNVEGTEHDVIPSHNEHFNQNQSHDYHHDTIFLIILFYYFQDSSLLSVVTPYIIPNISVTNKMKEIIIGLFEFRLDIFYLDTDICMFPGIDAVGKTALQTMFFPLMWLITLTVYIISKHCRNQMKIKMIFRSATAFMLSILFAFQKLALAYMSLIQCTMMFDTSVLVIKATTQCYTYWQFSVFAYLSVSIIPLGIYIMFCTKFLEESQISLGIFFLGCFVPLPVILYCIILAIWQQTIIAKRVLSPDAHAVYKMIQGPYRRMTLFGVDIGWGGVIILRRTVLIGISTFVEFPLLRSILLFLVCSGCLLHHVNISPYIDNKANIADSLSQGALTIISGINVARAMLDSQQSLPLTPTQSMLTLIDYIDQILQLWLPIAGVFIIILLLLVRTSTIIKHIKCRKNSTND